MPDGPAMQVFCRFRPVSELETEAGGVEIVEYALGGRGVTLVNPATERPTPFAFQHVFPPAVSQQEVYAAAGRPLLDAVIGGYNAAVICYGQTASGKTHTMFGPPTDPDAGGDEGAPDMRDATNSGILPRIVGELFNRLDALPGGMYPTVKCSYLELYMENVMGLLVRGRPKLQLRDYGDVCTTNACDSNS